MKLDDLKPSDNFEDRRGQGGGFGFPGGGRRINIPIGGGRGGGLSIKTIVVLVIIYFVLRMMGIDLLEVLNGGNPQGPGGTSGTEITYPDGSVTGSGSGTQIGEEQGNKDVTGDAGSLFVRRVLTSTEQVWGDYFKSQGQTYRPPTLVVFNGVVRSACGMAQAAMGPFYCPPDQKVYIDLAFYQEMRNKLGAPGDFAQGYVIAHEVGHHVQNLLGIAEKVQEARSRASETVSNELSVRMELQADCFAGIWGQRIDEANRMEAGDLEEALNAAAQIGDDRLQKRSQGYVVPESFTHGTSEQRVRWFQKGFKARSLQDCNTFATDNL
jgi:hypothetical protein